MIYKNGKVIPFVDGNMVSVYKGGELIYTDGDETWKPYPSKFLDYIEATGTQWISTGIILDGDTSEVFIDAMMTSEHNGDEVLFGSYSPKSNRSGYLNWFNNHYEVHTGDYIGGGIGYQIEVLERFTFKIQTDNINKTFTTFFNDEKVADNISFGGNVDTGKSMGLFCINDNTLLVGGMRLYEWYVKKENLLVQKFKPCIYEEQIGVWDIVTNTFFENKGNTPFNYGV